MSNFVADRHYYVDESKSIIVDESDPRAAFLLIAMGHELPEAEARRYGLIKDEVEVRHVPESKANSGPAENKAVLEPEANKSDATAPSGESNASPDGSERGEATDDEAESDSTPPDLESLKVTELRALAEKEGADLSGTTLKADIIAAIQLKREE